MDNKLTILWTNADPITAKLMVFMYAENSLKYEWWDQVSLIIWGAPTKLVAENKEIRDKLIDLSNLGVEISFCRACAEELGVSEQLIQQGFELIYWGRPLSDIIKSKQHLITI